MLKIILNLSKKLKKKNGNLLHSAALGNSKWIVEFLMTKGEDINTKDIIYLKRIRFFFIKKFVNQKRILNKMNRNPLHYAARRNRKDVGELLISKGADVNAIDLNNQKIMIFSLIKRIENK